MDTSLELTALRKRYGATLAVDGVSLALGRSETLALLGPSGCGKSTLLRMVAGLEAPDGGSVALAGRDVTALPPQRRGFGMVFQDFALFPHLDVGRNVAFGLVERRWPVERRRARVREMLALVGLEGLERRRVQGLSGGQRQRVALARALAPSPEVLLFDEPLSNLDQALRASLQDELRTVLADLGLCAIYVTHDQAEAFVLAPRVALMRDGRLVQTGTREALLERPRDAWTARFLGHANVYPSSRGLPPAGGGPVLLRADLVGLLPATDAAPGGVEARVRAARRTGLAWSLTLVVPSWGVEVAWQGFPRELASQPVPGAEVRLRVPPEAWWPLEAA